LRVGDRRRSKKNSEDYSENRDKSIAPFSDFPGQVCWCLLKQTGKLPFYRESMLFASHSALWRQPCLCEIEFLLWIREVPRNSCGLFRVWVWVAMYPRLLPSTA
jgi:hypothetical protein